jgi:hypothetical protein
MFKELLDWIVSKKIYVQISGVTPAGTEKTLGGSGLYSQGDIVFTAPMVKEIKFHANGCTIILKH